MNYEKYFFDRNIKLENAFEHLYKNFIPTLSTYNFLVDWDKVLKNKSSYEIKLNILNALIGRCDEEFYKLFDEIIRNYPEVVEVFPILLAAREDVLEFIDNLEELKVEKYVFKKPALINEDIVNHYYKFFKKTGLYELFCKKEIKNLVDYVFGVEVGLNSNARKNRTGTSMELIVKNFLENFCNKEKDFEFLEQATKDKIKQKWDVNIEIDKNNRRFDFALFDTRNKKLYLMEVNFYNSPGSKLKATAGEYKELNDFIKKQGHTLIWITDGKGWKTSLNALEETFHHNDYVINLKMLKEGILEYICKK